MVQPKKVFGLAMAVVFVGATVIAGAGPAAATSRVNASRLGGADRYETAALVAATAFPDGADNAIVATGASYPDALGASFLAAKFSGPTTQQGGPVLLTDPQVASPAMLRALSALRVKNVTIVGGDLAVSHAVESTIASTPSTNTAGGPIVVTRLNGAGRYDTNKLIDEQLPGVGGATASSSGAVTAGGSVPTAIIASGQGFADALAAAPVASADGLPIVLTDTNQLVPQAGQILGDLGIKQVIIMGGTSAVSTAAEQEINAIGVQTLRRFAGRTRYETAAEFASAGLLQHVKAAVALGTDFPDALAAGPLAGSNAEPLLLLDGPRPETTAYVTGAASLLHHLDVLGGTTAIPDAQVVALEQSAGSSSTAIGRTAAFADNDTGKQASVIVGDSVQLNLSAAFDSGFSWSLTQPPDPAILANQSTQMTAHHFAGAVGGGGTEIFNFATVGAGTTTIGLSYFAPGATTPSATYFINVVAAVA